MFKAVRNKKIFEEILDQIKELLMTKQLVIGQKIPSEIELAESIGISRSSLREALKVLSVLGIIESKTGEGTIIKQASLDNLRNIMSLVAVSYGLDPVELFEVRTILEMKAAKLAAIRRDENDLELIKNILIEMDSFDPQNSSLLDFQFHTSIVKATQNKMLIMLMELISGLLGEQIKNTRDQLARSTKYSKKFQEEHWMLYRAIAEKDPEKAESVMKEHLTFVQIKLGLIKEETM